MMDVTAHGLRNEEAGGSGDECFVCLELGGRPCSCNCKTMRIHDNCLIKLVESKNSRTCGVCKSDFTNVYTKRRLVLTVAGKRVFGILGILAILLAAEISIHFVFKDIVTLYIAIVLCPVFLSIAHIVRFASRNNTPAPLFEIAVTGVAVSSGPL